MEPILLAQLHKLIKTNEVKFSQLMHGSNQGIVINFPFHHFSTLDVDSRLKILYLLLFNDGQFHFERLFQALEFLLSEYPHNLGDKIQEISFNIKSHSIEDQLKSINYNVALGEIEYSGQFCLGLKSCFITEELIRILCSQILGTEITEPLESVIGSDEVIGFNDSIFNVENFAIPKKDSNWTSFKDINNFLANVEAKIEEPIIEPVEDIFIESPEIIEEDREINMMVEDVQPEEPIPVEEEIKSVPGLRSIEALEANFPEHLIETVNINSPSTPTQQGGCCIIN